MFELDIVDADEDDELSELQLDLVDMGWLRELMRRAELLSDEAIELPDLPEELEPLADELDWLTELAQQIVNQARESGLPLDRDERAVGEHLRAMFGEALPAARVAQYWTFREAMERKLTSSAQTGLASCKLESNDGWLVTPRECSAVAEGLRTAMERHGDDLLPTSVPEDVMALIEELRQEYPEEVLEDAGIEVPSGESASELVQLWIAFHEQAAERGGYRVH
jgi:hypothetical protein